MQLTSTGCTDAVVDRAPVAEWLEILATNLTDSYICICGREAFAAMKAQMPRGGRIINKD